MIDVVKAIKTRWTAKSLSSSVTGGIHHSRVPERTAMPYCVFRELGSPVIAKSRMLRMSELQLQFEIYDDSGDAEDVADLAVTVRDAFAESDGALTDPLATGTTTRVYDADVTRNVVVDSEGMEQVYRATFELAVRFTEPRVLNPS